MNISISTYMTVIDESSAQFLANSCGEGVVYRILLTSVAVMTFGFQHSLLQLSQKMVYFKASIG